ncbi:MAG TPA: response regulator transcription factor [Anaerolineales bacterium]|nr:response regulator transcription factor [Anaerolineales bacterium]
MAKIRVLLAEDHTIVRKGLRALLDGQAGIEVIAEAEDGRQAVRLAEQLRPDVVLMDFSMPGLNGLEATRQIAERVPGARVVVLTRHTNQEYAERILKAGASGYLVKKSAPEELIIAIQAVYRGDSYLDPAITTNILHAYLKKSSPVGQDRFDNLTPRQREVLQLIAEGHANREIAALLNVSIKTVESHRAAIMDALELHSTAELTQYAIRKGMISLDE